MLITPQMIEAAKQVPDRISADFNPMSQSFIGEYNTWQQQFHNDMYLKHGRKAKNIKATHFEMDTPIGKRVTCVLEVELR